MPANIPLPAAAPGWLHWDVILCTLSCTAQPHLTQRPPGKGAALPDETLPPQIQLLPPETDKFYVGKEKDTWKHFRHI